MHGYIKKNKTDSQTQLNKTFALNWIDNEPEDKYGVSLTLYSPGLIECSLI